MWRRAYLFLLLVRLYFALSPSYLHPDENFQGPEVIAGRVFSYPVHLTWEFTAQNPIRSSFPLWICYGIPMFTLRVVWDGFAQGTVPPHVVYWTLRFLMFTLSMVLEDWAILELISSPRQRKVAQMLVASSYVTWTLQTHTFSNSLETLALIWCMVLIQRIEHDKRHSSLPASAVLGFLAVVGVFNRITFPAYLVVPALQLLSHFQRKPLSLIVLLLSAALTAMAAIAFDTSFYTQGEITLSDLVLRPVITPLNNLLYNSSASNLAKHGLHPYYQHLVANLPQLLGPTYPLIFLSFRKNLRTAAAVTGITLLSVFPHQEARFLLPTIPLLLTSIRLPDPLVNRRLWRAWLASWIAFNAVMGVFMGVYHQGGVVPAQMWIARHGEPGLARVFWWKTYSPPVWLLNGRNAVVDTVDLMGMPRTNMVTRVVDGSACSDQDHHANNLTYLVAPRSATFLDRFRQDSGDTDEQVPFRLDEVWSYGKHINLDDMDFGDDGVVPTLSRVIGRRGISVWKVQKQC
ncbi:glycosyltransferase family 22 protein [Phyllosticta citrichinensis]|uniref:Mannosyltransferase n=1 Tax=Phyllosticta citrichinensis TaxID=1130410 RepID=A0ABR1XWS6_9PEZI